MSPDGTADGATAEPDLWRALASPWRRRLLDLLRDGPQSTGVLADAMPELSRFAVMQHLEVLTNAGVVLVERRGRHRMNHLNPVPLRDWYERWVVPVADSSAAGLLALRRAVEATPATAASTTSPTEEKTVSTIETEQVRIVRIACELRFTTTPERLFHTLTQDTGAWFPHTYGGDRVQRLVLEPRVGGALYEDWGDGAGHLYAQVTEYDPPRLYATRGRLGPGVILDTEYTITADGDEVVLRVMRVAVGPITEDEAAGINAFGDLTNFADAIRNAVEG